MKENSIGRIAAVADIHIAKTDTGKWAPYFTRVSAEADVLLICGDLTNTGDQEEAEILVDELNGCNIPVIAVLGNHDYEKGQQKEIRKIMRNANVDVLDGESVVIGNVGFAGVKGFGGGFNNRMLSYFGENAMKAFVQEALTEALHLDRALAQIEKEYGDIPKIALLHYSPIQATVEGEPEAIYPFLGSSRLEEPLNKRKVIATFHGHAHIGKFEGTTSEGYKVFNVARHVLEKNKTPGPFFLFEMPVEVKRPVLR